MTIKISRDGNEHDFFDIVQRQLTRLDGAIEKEFTLINDRMTWMVISESFIFGPFAIAITAYSSAPKDFINVILALVIMLPAIGVAIAFYAMQAIRAAHDAADDLKESRKLLENLYQGDLLRLNLIDVTYKQRERGTTPSRFLPLLIIFSWTLILGMVVAELISHGNGDSIPIPMPVAFFLLYVFATILYGCIRCPTLSKLREQKA